MFDGGDDDAVRCDEARDLDNIADDAVSCTDAGDGRLCGDCGYYGSDRPAYVQSWLV